MPLIAVLEDDPRRIAAIRGAAESDLADCEIQVFSNARQMEQWLTQNLHRVLLRPFRDAEQWATDVHEALRQSDSSSS